MNQQNTEPNSELMQALASINYETLCTHTNNHRIAKIPLKQLTDNISNQELLSQLKHNPIEFTKELATIIGTENTKMQLENAIVNIIYIDPPENKIQVSKIRSDNLNQLIITTGLIKKISPVFTTTTEKIYVCNLCATEITIKYTETENTKERNPYCRTCKTKTKLKKENQMDIMTIEILEENFEQSKIGQMNSITAILKNHLTSPDQIKDIQIGDKATIIGILNKKDDLKNINAFVIQTLGITTERAEDHITITPEEETEFKAIPNKVEYWATNLFTNIHGMQDIRETIICNLIGLPAMQNQSQRTRGAFHMGIFGDPSIAKSTILLMAKEYALKGRYTSATGASGVGLTASVIHDEYTKTWTAEAGAMVLADGGHIFIDELEKMNEDDHNKLHEGLEQQHITVAKAGLTITLPCRTTLICAGNPKTGEVANAYEPLAKQLNLSPAFLSRLDIKWLLKQEFDQHTEAIFDKSIGSVAGTNNEGKEEPIEQFKKFTILARRQDPELTLEVHNEIKKYLLDLMKKYQDKEERPPLSPRSSQALTRLTMTHAKAELKKQTTIEDWEWAKKVYVNSLRTLGIDVDNAKFTMQDLEKDKTLSDKKIREMILLRLEEKNKEIVYWSQIRELFDEKIPNSTIQKVLDQMCSHTEVTRPKGDAGGAYKLI